MGDLAIAIDAAALQPGVLDQAEQALILPVVEDAGSAFQA
jgi:hypothetical protein